MLGWAAPAYHKRLGWAAPAYHKRLGWAAPAYHKEEGAAPRPGVRMFGLQYDGRSAERFGLRVSIVEFRQSERKGGRSLCEVRRMVYVCCLLEVRWRGQGARMLGMKGRRYNMWWS